MCGIAGVLSRATGRVAPAVRAMMRAMVHRGPDDEGYAEVVLTAGSTAGSPPTCGFGFRRLAILDLSAAGHQPMVNPASGDCLIFNGEIYNFASLRDELRSKGVSFRSTGDTEVLLQALSIWGEATLDRLDGMFAFAFLQAATGRVLLARDPLGVKPLYVAHLSDTVVFASEVRAVLASGMVPDDLDPAGIAGYLAYGSPQDPLTVHRHIRSLPAGSSMWIDQHTLDGKEPSTRRYWRFPFPQDIGEAEATRSLHDDLAAAVRDQCVADVPLGVFLSGGVDSATLAGFARAGGVDIATFSVGFERHGGKDELEDAAATAAALDTRHYQTVLDDDWIQAQWQQWLKAADRPSIDGLNMYIVSGAVSDLDTKVALSGIGADELFGGYPNFRSVPKLRRSLAALGWLPRRARRGLAGLAFSLSRPSRKKRAVALASTGTSVLDVALFMRRLIDDDDLRALGFEAGALGLRPDFLTAESVRPLERLRGDAFRTISQAECVLYMGNTLLRDADINSMAHSLEVRVPFLGRRVVETACRTPSRILAPREAPMKHLLRQAAVSVIPPAVLNRPKRGFSLPLGDWMFGSLRDACEAAIDEVAACPLFDAAAVRSLWEECRRLGKTVHWTRPLSLVALGNYLSETKRRLPGRAKFDDRLAG